jgi:putative ABC transport system substrate-binding protein
VNFANKHGEFIMKKIFLAVTTVAIASTVAFLNINVKKEGLPIVAIANYGPLKDLEISIQGIKDELADSGFIDNATVKIEIADIAFDHSLIPQTIANLKNHNPRVMVAISTPIAQFAKGKIRDIPLIFREFSFKDR